MVSLFVLLLLFAQRFLCCTVPVIAIATKFDSLVAQVFTRKKGLDKSREEAIKLLEDKLEGPLRKFKFPPRAYVRLEGMLCD